MLSTEYAIRPGSVRFLELDSRLLRGNRWGDPALRRHPVYLPPGYFDVPEREYPLVLALIGYTGTGFHYFAPGTFREALHQRIDRLIATGLEPLIVLAVDAYTSLGGSQYVNGVCGPYEDYILQELLPAARAELRTTADRVGVGVMGTSSGGFGALHLAMRHPQTFTAVAAHSADAAFELSIWPAVPATIAVFDRFPGDEDTLLRSFLASFRASQQPSYEEGHALMMLACAAAYSPDPSSGLGFRLPFDPRTGACREDVWTRWLAMDPVRRVADHASDLRRLRLLYFDCGNRDQYASHLGARQLQRELQRFDLPHVYEEFDGTHSGLQHRYDVSIPRLVTALGGKAA